MNGSPWYAFAVRADEPRWISVTLRYTDFFHRYHPEDLLLKGSGMTARQSAPWAGHLATRASRADGDTILLHEWVRMDHVGRYPVPDRGGPAGDRRGADQRWWMRLEAGGLTGREAAPVEGPPRTVGLACRGGSQRPSPARSSASAGGHRCAGPASVHAPAPGGRRAGHAVPDPLARHRDPADEPGRGWTAGIGGTMEAVWTSTGTGGSCSSPRRVPLRRSWKGTSEDAITDRFHSTWKDILYPQDSTANDTITPAGWTASMRCWERPRRVVRCPSSRRSPPCTGPRRMASRRWCTRWG